LRRAKQTRDVYVHFGFDWRSDTKEFTAVLFVGGVVGVIPE
jgi:hypothetical protein